MNNQYFKNTLLEIVGEKHNGINSILDKGLPFDIYQSYIESFAKHVHMIKFGWTTWALFSDLEFQKKISLAKKMQIPICLGGTLFEIAYTRGMFEELLNFIKKAI